MSVPRYYDGSPQITLLLPEELHAWCVTKGGRRFIRNVIMNEYNKKHRELHDFVIDFGKDVVKVKQNVRLHPSVHDFVLRIGGLPWVRDLLYRMMITERKMIRERERASRSQ